MVTIIVYGICEKRELKKFVEALVNTAACAVEELDIKVTDVSLFFPKCHMINNWGEKIFALVNLINKPERTEEAKNRLAQSIALTISHFFPETKSIECFVKTFNPKKGYSSLIK